MNNVDELIQLEKIIKNMHYPTLQKLMEETGRSRNTVLRNIEKINDYFESRYEEFENRKMIRNSRESGKQGYYYVDPNYSISLEDVIDSKSRMIQDEKRDELIEFLKRKVTGPGKSHARVDKKIKESIVNTEERLDACKTLDKVLFFYDDARLSTHGKNDVAAELVRNHLLCFESPEIMEVVESYRKYL